MATVSPCVKVCRYDGGDVCIGCRRTAEEISVWWRLSDAEAQAIMATLADRPSPQ